ncbi:MAG: hypothetical protein AB8F78_02420 [Saprospiraceae bacterium]
MKLLSFLLAGAMLLLVLAKAEAQNSSMTISALLDSMATEAVIYQGIFGFSAKTSPRGLWLEELVGRRSEWFHLDSLSSNRSTTRAVAVLSLDMNDEQQLFSAFAKTLCDTAVLKIGRGCVYTELMVSELVGGKISEALATVNEFGREEHARLRLRMDSILLTSDCIAGRAELSRLQKLHGTDSLGAVAQLRRVYSNTDEAEALMLIRGYEYAADSSLLFERLSRTNVREVAEALRLYTGGDARHLKAVLPLAIQLAPQFGAFAQGDFKRALYGALKRTPQKEGEEILAQLEPAFTQEQRSQFSWLSSLREEWE